MKSFDTIDEEEVEKWCDGSNFTSSREVLVSYLTEILNGKYPLDEAREDILSHRGQTP